LEPVDFRVNNLLFYPEIYLKALEFNRELNQYNHIIFMRFSGMLNSIIDCTLFLAANLYNLLMVAIFLSRPAGLARLEHNLGLFAVTLAFPLLAGVVLNAGLGRDGWFILLPVPLVIYLFVEWLLDYFLKLTFRNTRLLWPYLMLYYLGLLGMIGYTFMADRFYGFVTLFTYFLNLFATWYSYSKTGHTTAPKK